MQKFLGKIFILLAISGGFLFYSASATKTQAVTDVLNIPGSLDLHGTVEISVYANSPTPITINLYRESTDPSLNYIGSLSPDTSVPPTSSVSPWRYQWDTRSLSNGEYKIFARITRNNLSDAPITSDQSS